jgi:hypothetical protein
MRIACRTMLLSLGVLASVSSLAEPVRISNRAAQAEEWGYHPADGSTVQLNPPSLTWVHETNAVRYTVQWARQSEFTEAVTVTNIPWPTYTHDTNLGPGVWFWRYQFADGSNALSEWSQTRSFNVPTGAVVFPMPTPAQQRARAPQQHPRLFMRPEDLPRLRTLAAGDAAPAFRKLRVEADRVLRNGPTPEPVQIGSARNKDDMEAVRYWWPNREQAERACKEAETLAFVYLITQDKKYGEGAHKWVLHLAGWDPDGPTNFKLNCEAAKPLLFRPARAYDWAWDMFTAAERVKIRASMRRRVQDAWESGEVQRGVGHLNRPYSSHGNRVWHKLGEAGLAFLDEIPEAPTWLDYAVNKFYACYPVWSDQDGGWHEGLSYWSGYLGKAVWWLEVAHSALGIDGLKKPFFAQTGDYPLYIAPPGSPNSGFGDLSYNRPSTGVGAFMDYFIRMQAGQREGSHAPYWRWWTEQWSMKSESGVLGFLHAANLPPLPPARPPTDLPPSKVFHGIGVASLHTTLLAARDDVHLLFKSSPFGSQSHGHNAQNTFQLNAYGEALLTICVYRDLHGSRFHFGWAHSTMAQNGVLVNGQGQIKHSAAAQGRICAEELTRGYDYVAGDASAAYGGALTRAMRHVVLVKGAVPFLVLYDDLAAPAPASFQFLLHASQKFMVDGEAVQGRVVLPKASVTARYFSPVPLAFRQWDGYEPKPTREFPDQWHLQAGTAEKRKELAMLTVIVPSRAEHTKEWKADRFEDPAVVGIHFECDGQKWAVSFPKAGAPGRVQVTGGD